MPEHTFALLVKTSKPRNLDGIFIRKLKEPYTVLAARFFFQ
jgi:hypothetical protein